MLDTDTLLLPTKQTDNQVIALMDVVRANTAAFKDIRNDLTQCNNQEKVQGVINKVETALQDLSLESQKIDPWIKAEPKDVNYGTVAYGQYPINAPLNPHNPVPLPPGYTPPGSSTVAGEPAQKAPPAHVEAEKPTRHEASQAKPAPVQHPDPRGKK